MSDAKTLTAIYVPPANIPPPKPLVLDDNLAASWKTWKKAWNRFEIATGVYKQDSVIRVSALLSIIGVKMVSKRWTHLRGMRTRAKTT